MASMTRAISVWFPIPACQSLRSLTTSEPFGTTGYSLLVSYQIELTTDLLSAGFWNYLREDITVALIEKRCLMIELSAQNLPHAAEEEDDFPNHITFLLGKVINRCLPEDALTLDVLG